MLENKSPQRLRIEIFGAIQGVGFRPFVYQCAIKRNLKGWVCNASSGVLIEVEGTRSALDEFLCDISCQKPSMAVIHSLKTVFLDALGYTEFEIKKSQGHTQKTTLIMPDLATCPHCLTEIFDRANRRFAYPFTNCTHCGPRYSIMNNIPYDRVFTSMQKFDMCDDCRAEFELPADRRFHAQPNACRQCGPQLELWDADGDVLAGQESALNEAVKAISAGKIVAVKGLGGFHLMVAANNAQALERLRVRKHREEKPFAVMFPSMEKVKQACWVEDIEEHWLLSPESPIVLLKKRKETIAQFVDERVAINNPYLGVMLPYTPLHHLLMQAFNLVVVATSANISDEPMCIDENEALVRLKGIADVFLVHNRPIVRPVDDSIVRVMGGRMMVLRRARGFAPLPVHLQKELPCVLAVGGHLKDTIALSIKDNVFISQHIGDLETSASLSAFENAMTSFQLFYDSTIEKLACDLHPEYLSTKTIAKMSLPTIAVQHHHAHIVSCMVENDLDGEVLGIAWDGTGYGADHTIWGGEFLKTTLSDYERVAHIACFPLPGGEKAVKEPRRSALGLLYACFGKDCFSFVDLPTLQAFSKQELDAIETMLVNDVNTPLTSSVGRLFDAVSSLLGLQQMINFEGQAAMQLEFAAEENLCEEFYDFDLGRKGDAGKCWVIGVKAMVGGVIADIRAKKEVGVIAAKFHNTLCEIVVALAKKCGLERVVLSGGCFQNKRLTEMIIFRLEVVGFKVYWHQSVPPNDGGLSLGQIVIAGSKNKKDE